MHFFLALFYFIFPNWIIMFVCVFLRACSISFPCKVLPTLTLSWFPKLAFFGSEDYSSSTFHLGAPVLTPSSPHVFPWLAPSCLSSLSSEGTTSEKPFLTSQHHILILFIEQTTTWNYPVHSFNWFILAFIHSAHCTRSGTYCPGLHLVSSNRTWHIGGTKNIFI